jgi:hypothetical protein
MKPDTTALGSPFNFDTIPVWLYADVWDENKLVKFRGLWFIVLYTISTLIFGCCVFLPIALFTGGWKPLVVMLLIGGGIFGILTGLAAWWDFTKRARKLKAEK